VPVDGFENCVKDLYIELRVLLGRKKYGLLVGAAFELNQINSFEERFGNLDYYLIDL